MGFLLSVFRRKFIFINSLPSARSPILRVSMTFVIATKAPRFSVRLCSVQNFLHKNMRDFWVYLPQSVHCVLYHSRQHFVKILPSISAYPDANPSFSGRSVYFAQKTTIYCVFAQKLFRRSVKTYPTQNFKLFVKFQVWMCFSHTQTHFYRSILLFIIIGNGISLVAFA